MCATAGCSVCYAGRFVLLYALLRRGGKTFGVPDLFACNTLVPQDREFVLPRHLSAFNMENCPDHVKKLFALRRKTPLQLPENGTLESGLSLPSLEKLSAQAPELL